MSRQLQLGADGGWRIEEVDAHGHVSTRERGTAAHVLARWFAGESAPEGGAVHMRDSRGNVVASRWCSSSTRGTGVVR